MRELVRGAAALEPRERDRLELVMLGSEVVAGYDDELRRAAGDVRLVFAGTYTHADLAARLAAIGGAHLGAFPSRAFESYGLVPDELMALGLPVWVTERGAPKERVGRAGRVLPAEDPPAWTRALAGPRRPRRARARAPRPADPHARWPTPHASSTRSIPASGAELKRATTGNTALDCALSRARSPSGILRGHRP